MKSMDGLVMIFEAAENHGAAGDPDHEVGDLHGVLETCWGLLTEGQRQAVLAEHRELLGWAPVGMGGNGASDDAFLERYEREAE